MLFCMQNNILFPIYNTTVLFCWISNYLVTNTYNVHWKSRNNRIYHGKCIWKWMFFLNLKHNTFCYYNVTAKYPFNNLFRIILLSIIYIIRYFLWMFYFCLSTYAEVFKLTTSFSLISLLCIVCIRINSKFFS